MESYLTPGTEEYVRLVSRLRDLLRRSASSVANQHKRWNRSEELLWAYVNPDEKQPDQYRSEEKYPYGGIVIPYSYAAMQVVLTYLYTVFGSRSPLFSLEATGGEDQKPAEAMSTIIEYQMRRRKARLHMYAWFQDALRYGCGVMKCGTWLDDWRTQVRVEMQRPTIFGLTVPGLPGKKVVHREPILIYEGNDQSVHDPYQYLPDPNVPIISPQDGDFVGFRYLKSWTHVKSMLNQKIYVNEDAIPEKNYGIDKDGVFVALEGRGTERDLIMNIANQIYSNHTEKQPYEIIEIYVKVIPDEWDLGSSDEVEKWVFTLVNGTALCRAEALHLGHDSFPVSVIEPNVDLHTQFVPSLVDQLRGLQDVLDWQFNSHFESVRKQLNLNAIYDPSMIEEDDLTSAQPSRLVRLTEDAYGNPNAVNMYFKELGNLDPTAKNLQDSDIVINLMQRVSAATDAMMGVYPESRRTATESSAVFQTGANRLKVLAELLYVMGIVDWGEMSVMNTQALLSQPRAYRILGEGVDQGLGSSMFLGPEDVQGQFDFPLADGAMPLDKVGVTQVWKEILTLVLQGQMGQKFMDYDLDAIFQEMVKTMGVKNINQFKLAPDEAVARQAQAGNLVATGGPNAQGGPNPIAALAQGAPGMASLGGTSPRTLQ